jgi:hypothetical protein
MTPDQARTLVAEEVARNPALGPVADKAVARLLELHQHPPAAPMVAFDVNEANRAGDAWMFNCGPAALCAVTGKTPEEIRPLLGDFEQKGYTNPTLMLGILARTGIKHRDLIKLYPRNVQRWPAFGLVRVQWGGPWTREGVPMAARYRHTHWIACAGGDGVLEPRQVFDVNAMCVGGWMRFAEWRDDLVPWLLKEAVPKADGKWWITHALELAR